MLLDYPKMPAKGELRYIIRCDFDCDYDPWYLAHPDAPDTEPVFDTGLSVCDGPPTRPEIARFDTAEAAEASAVEMEKHMSDGVVVSVRLNVFLDPETLSEVLRASPQTELETLCESMRTANGTIPETTP